MITDFKNYLLLERKLNIELLSRYDSWWKNFLHKLQMNEPFPIDEFNDVQIKNVRKIISAIVDIDTGKVDKQKAYDFFTEKGVKGSKYNKKAIKLTNGDKIGLNDLVRTWEFGSSPGTSTGTRQTRVNETIQAIYLAIRHKLKRSINENDIQNFIDEYDDEDSEFVNKILKKVGLNVRISKEDLLARGDWMHTHIEIANALFDLLDDEDRFFFYQAFFDLEGSLPRIIRTKYYDILRDMKINIKIDFAKWNPADIFVVNEEFEDDIKARIAMCNNMEDLNITMDYYFDNKQLIGLSLKKIHPERIPYFVVNKTEVSDFKYIKSTASADPIASMSVNIHAEVESTIPTAKERIMTSRIYTGDQISNMVLEIKGSTSKYGKASMSYLNKILERLDIEPIPPHNSWEIEHMSEEDLVEAITEYYSILKIGTTNTKGERHNIKDSRSRLIGKYQSLILVDILETNKNKPIRSGIIGELLLLLNKKRNKTDYIMKSLFYYAYAMGNELFENCKYYRIGDSA